MVFRYQPLTANGIKWAPKPMVAAAAVLLTITSVRAASTAGTQPTTRPTDKAAIQQFHISVASITYTSTVEREGQDQLQQQPPTLYLRLRVTYPARYQPQRYWLGRFGRFQTNTGEAIKPNPNQVGGGYQVWPSSSVRDKPGFYFEIKLPQLKTPARTIVQGSGYLKVRVAMPPQSTMTIKPIKAHLGQALAIPGHPGETLRLTRRTKPLFGKAKITTIRLHLPDKKMARLFAGATFLDANGKAFPSDSPIGSQPPQMIHPPKHNGSVNIDYVFIPLSKFPNPDDYRMVMHFYDHAAILKLPYAVKDVPLPHMMPTKP